MPQLERTPHAATKDPTHCDKDPVYHNKDPTQPNKLKKKKKVNVLATSTQIEVVLKIVCMKKQDTFIWAVQLVTLSTNSHPSQTHGDLFVCLFVFEETSLNQLWKNLKMNQWPEPHSLPCPGLPTWLRLNGTNYRL